MKKLFALALVATALFGCEATENKRADQVGETVVGQALARGKDADVMSDLATVRQAVELYQATNDAYPPSLDVLGLPQESLVNRIDGRPFLYDPATGRVWTDHPGHEKY